MDTKKTEKPTPADTGWKNPLTPKTEAPAASVEQPKTAPADGIEKQPVEAVAGVNSLGEETGDGDVQDDGDTILSVGTERPLTTHSPNAPADALRPIAVDVDGDASPIYLVAVADGVKVDEGGPFGQSLEIAIPFQIGPVHEAGVNGITNEVLLAIVQDRLEQFQAGQFPCHENAVALAKVREALAMLHHRTRDRMARGVEGKNIA